MSDRASELSEWYPGTRCYMAGKVIAQTGWSAQFLLRLGCESEAGIGEWAMQTGMNTWAEAE